MTRHPFRWEALIFGLGFLGVVSLWSSWTFDLVDPDQLAYVGAEGLIVLGVAGIIASLAAPRKAVKPEEVPDDVEETDPQSR